MNLNQNWKSKLNNELTSDYFQKLWQTIELEYQTKTCFPDKDKIFEAFNQCDFDNINVVIIAQDPYHGDNQANGLCFSSNSNTPPSLINIFKEIESDLNKTINKQTNLTGWAKQGVLLLNSNLTVRKAQANSHKGLGWEKFTDAVIKKISNQKENVIFLLWGNFAKQKAKHIDTNKHFILTSGHPSPLSANKGLWFGNKHFSQTNSILKKLNKPEILW